jgi:hypothetical protein
MTSVPRRKAGDQPAGRTYTRPCQFCDTPVTVTNSVTGPAECCPACAARLVAIVYGDHGAELMPEFLFPLDGFPVTCGNRKDLPRKQRVHGPWAYLGTDARHVGDGTFEDLHIYACAKCGRDRQTRTPPAGG